MTTSDPYAQWDAAYVLGALSPAERGEYEEHLAGCASCRSALADLAGVPAALGLVPPGEVLAMDLDDDALPPPPSALLHPVAGRPAQRWARWRRPLAVAAAALLIGGVGGYAVGSATRDPGPAVVATGPHRLAFSPVGPSTMTAVVDVVPTADGTTLSVQCQYASADGGAPPAYTDYAIWVVDRDGRGQEIRTWTARPGTLMHPSGVASLPVASIASVEIRRVDTGATVMRAAVT